MQAPQRLNGLANDALADKRRFYARFARFINAVLAAERGVLQTHGEVT